MSPAKLSIKSAAFVCILFASHMLQAQQLYPSPEEVIQIPAATATNSHPATTPATIQEVSNSHILGKIPDGTTPPQAAPMPKLAIASQDVLQTTTHLQGGRTITIHEIKAIPLPSPPLPVLKQMNTAADNTYSKKITEYRAAHPKSDLLIFGATVFRSSGSPARTLVRYWPQGRGESITFWSSADFALIAGGINSFVDTSADTHHIFMACSTIDIDQMTARMASKGRQYATPEMPEFPEGKVTFTVTGGQASAEDLIPIQSLHDLYDKECARLRAAYEGREQARIAREALLKAHPPQPKDITLNFWRSEKPASKEQGGSAR